MPAQGFEESGASAGQKHIRSWPQVQVRSELKSKSFPWPLSRYLDVLDKTAPLGAEASGSSVLWYQSVWLSKCSHVFNKFRLITPRICLLHLCNSCLYSSSLLDIKDKKLDSLADSSRRCGSGWNAYSITVISVTSLCSVVKYKSMDAYNSSQMLALFGAKVRPQVRCFPLTAKWFLGHFHSIKQNGASISQWGSLMSQPFLFDAHKVQILLPFQTNTNLLFLTDLLALTFCSHRVLPLCSRTGLIHWFLLLQ